MNSYLSVVDIQLLHHLNNRIIRNLLNVKKKTTPPPPQDEHGGDNATSSLTAMLDHQEHDEVEEEMEIPLEPGPAQKPQSSCCSRASTSISSDDSAGSEPSLVKRTDGEAQQNNIPFRIQIASYSSGWEDISDDDRSKQSCDPDDLTGWDADVAGLLPQNSTAAMELLLILGTWPE